MLPINFTWVTDLSIAIIAALEVLTVSDVDEAASGMSFLSHATGRS